MNTYEAGNLTEAWVMQRLIDAGLVPVFAGSYYDIDCGSVKIEVKSAQLSVSSGAHRRSGRFQFLDPESRKKHRAEGVYYAFLVRHEDCVLLLGFVESCVIRDVQYLSVHELLRHRLLSLDEFTCLIKSSSSITLSSTK